MHIIDYNTAQIATHDGGLEAVHSSVCALSSYNPRLSNIIPHASFSATCNKNNNNN
ncbi:KR domain-containing protein [Aspergillus luchuensis]|uniref:KR domain-containing protein n=1 Tax=Aspergillus kawachii TaxID=1069201 RepID=A0A146FJL0_ASPKA|nr:KR domain-containing protein [Aspergillus luchuensis]